MKILFLLTGLGGVAFLLLYSCGCKAQQKQTPENTSKPAGREKTSKADPAIYKDLRAMAFTAPFIKADVLKSGDTSKVFGVIMDWNLGEGIATIVSFETGDASMYLSSGGGVIGGIEHENVKKQAKDFVLLAQSYLDKTEKIDSIPLPDKDCIRFYLLTSAGKFVVQEKMINIENQTSKWLPLFEKANLVINELRVVADMH